MRLHKYRGLIVHTIPLGEADLLVWALTSRGNLPRFVAKGARKTKSKFSAAVQPFVLGEYLLYTGSALPILRQAEIEESYMPLRQDLLRCTAALSVLELCRLLIAEEAGEEGAFTVVTAYLTTLKSSPFAASVFDWCRLRLVSSLGYGLQLDCCLDCGNVCQEGYISLAAGGLICRHCRAGSGNLLPITPELLQVLRQYLRVDLAGIYRCEFPLAQVRRVTKVVDKLIFWLTEGKTKTQSIRDRILSPLSATDC